MDYKENTLEKQLNKNRFKVLIVTATQLETEQLHFSLTPIIGVSKIISIPHNRQTYYLGKLGKYEVVHVQCSHMGAMAEGASILTVTNTLIDWPSISMAIMVGICFGVDNIGQKIGDVLISDSIIPYNIRKVGKNNETPRGNPLQSDRIICNAFRGLKQTWEFINNGYGKSDIDICPMLSGEELIDNITRRNQLIAENPTVRGGDMEGFGLATACNNRNIPWLLVKGICDFADGNKGKDKLERQQCGAVSAIECCKAALNSEYAFDSLGINIDSKVQQTYNRNTIDDVLFEMYNLEKSEFYVKRIDDLSINSTLLSKGMWIFGESGIGKTTSILYNLLGLDKEVILINLACCVSFSIEGFFEEILNQLISLTDSRIKIKSDNIQSYLNSILEIIEEQYPDKEVFIIVEEIPLDESSEFKLFVQSFCALIIKKQWKNSFSNTKFVLSSINSPIPHILTTQQKARQIIDFFPMKKWNQEECLELINLIISTLNLIWSEEKLKTSLVKSLDFSPRKIKTFFRTAMIKEIFEFDDKSINELIEETRRQF
jgi:nucleoside phosphorylase